MSDLIKIKTGNSVNTPTLAAGEMAFEKDTGYLLIGTESGENRIINIPNNPLSYDYDDKEFIATLDVVSNSPIVFVDTKLAAEDDSYFYLGASSTLNSNLSVCKLYKENFQLAIESQSNIIIQSSKHIVQDDTHLYNYYRTYGEYVNKINKSSLALEGIIDIMAPETGYTGTDRIRGVGISNNYIYVSAYDSYILKYHKSNMAFIESVQCVQYTGQSLVDDTRGMIYFSYDSSSSLKLTARYLENLAIHFNVVNFPNTTSTTVIGDMVQDDQFIYATRYNLGLYKINKSNLAELPIEIGGNMLAAGIKPGSTINALHGDFLYFQDMNQGNILKVNKYDTDGSTIEVVFNNILGDSYASTLLFSNNVAINQDKLYSIASQNLINLGIGRAKMGNDTYYYFGEEWE